MAIDITQLGADLFYAVPMFEAISSQSTSAITLKFTFIRKTYTKTMSFRDSLDEDKVKRNWIELFQLFENDFPTGNLPVEPTTPREGKNMSKEESIAKFRSTIEAQETAALGALFDEGKAEGGNFTKEEVDQAVRDALAALPPDTTPFSKEDVAAAVAEALAALPADQTPFSKEDLDKAVADAVAAVPKDEEMAAQLVAMKASNEKMKAAIQAEIDDAKVDSTRLESAIAPELPQGEVQA